MHKHPLAGRKQSPEHIAKRVAAIALARASWSAEKKASVSNKIKEANSRFYWTTEKVEAVENRRKESIAIVATKPVTIYGLVDPETKELRYIGKTSRNVSRRISAHAANARQGKRSHLYNWWRSLVERGSAPEAIIVEVVDVGKNWVDAEKYWISYYRGRGCNLTNLCDGGQGTDGIVFSPEHIERLRISHLGKTNSREAREKVGAASRAAWARNPNSRAKPDTLAKILATKAERRAAGLYKKRRPASEETKAKISAANKGRFASDQTRAKLSAVRKGRKLSEAHKLAISEGRKRRLSNIS